MSSTALALSNPCEAGATGAVMPVDIAAAKAIAAAVPVAETETLDLLASIGRVPASEVAARLDLPPFNASAMDGYAVKADNFAKPGPWRLQVAGRIAAGDVPKRSYEGSVRILTGARFRRDSMPSSCRRNAASTARSSSSAKDCARGRTCGSPGKICVAAICL